MLVSNFIFLISLVAQTVKCMPTIQETWVQSLGWKDLLEKEMATHSSILTWKIPWTEEPARLQSMGSQRVGHDRATSLFYFFNNILVWFWYWGDGGFIGCLWEYSFLFSLLKEFEKDSYKFFAVWMIEFTCEAIRPWTFVCRQFVFLLFFF